MDQRHRIRLPLHTHVAPPKRPFAIQPLHLGASTPPIITSGPVISLVEPVRREPLHKESPGRQGKEIPQAVKSVVTAPKETPISRLHDGNKENSEHDHVYVQGTDHQLARGLRHVYVRGRSHKISEALSHVHLDGSHGYATNSGERILSIPVTRQGVTKIGKAQQSTILLTANVDPQAKHYLINTGSFRFPTSDRIYLPHANSVGLISLKYTAIGVNHGSKIWETGELRNTVIVSNKGATEWPEGEVFTHHYQEGSLKHKLVFKGIPIAQEEGNCFSLEIENRIDHQIQLIVQLELLYLAF